MQLLCHPISTYDWILDIFYVLSMEFLLLSRIIIMFLLMKHPSAAMGEERHLFLQAGL